jgi:hemolysin III
MHHGERFNGYTHLAGVLLAAAGTAVLVTQAALRGDATRIVSFAVYGATLCLLYLFSTLYHGARGRAKDVLRKLDHVAIYLLIAGTYTPFALVTLHGAWGWSLFGAVWGLAALGIVQELSIARGARLASLAIYLLMGWLALVALGLLRLASGGGERREIGAPSQRRAHGRAVPRELQGHVHEVRDDRLPGPPGGALLLREPGGAGRRSRRAPDPGWRGALRRGVCAGWGNDVPEMLRNADWNYAVSTPDKQHRGGVNQGLCFACHKPLEKDSYLFTLKDLAAGARR